MCKSNLIKERYVKYFCFYSYKLFSVIIEIIKKIKNNDNQIILSIWRIILRICYFSFPFEITFIPWKQIQTWNEYKPHLSPIHKSLINYILLFYYWSTFYLDLVTNNIFDTLYYCSRIILYLFIFRPVSIQTEDTFVSLRNLYPGAAYDIKVISNK